jgi:glycosyltransferase involved in cell wall biosynthesis
LVFPRGADDLLPDAKSMIRIRFEHTRYGHWGARSGYSQFVQYLNPQRFQTILHGASQSDADLAWLRPMWPLLRALIRRGRMPWYNLSDLNAELFATAACLGGRADIVHFLDGDHSPQFLPRFLRLARLSKVRTVVTFHQPPQIAHELINTDLLRWIDQVVLISPSQIPFFMPHIPERRLHVILHGIDIEFFRPADSRRDTNVFRCVTVGHWLRDWNLMGRIVDALPEVRFDVITGADTGLSRFDNVHTHRGIDDGALADLYRNADVLLLPLTDSTANNALLEGMASGLPVVATDLPAVRAYLPEGGVLVPDNSVEDFIAALQALRQDISLRHAMGRSARARAEELAWPRMVREYEALYAKVAAD